MCHSWQKKKKVCGIRKILYPAVKRQLDCRFLSLYKLKFRLQKSIMQPDFFCGKRKNLHNIQKSIRGTIIVKKEDEWFVATCLENDYCIARKNR